MLSRQLSWLLALFTPVLVLAAFLAACGSDTKSDFDDQGGASSSSGASGGSSGSSGFGGGVDPEVTGITVEPATATLALESGTAGTQPFKAIATLADGSKREVVAAWTATNLPVGNVAPGTGMYSANGKLGGTVTVTATHKGKKAQAVLTVKLHLLENPTGVPAGTIAALKAAATPDATVKWAYPYDGTVFPRGLLAPQLMWNNGGAADVYYIHLTSGTFDLESFATAAPPSRFTFAQPTWQQLTDSTSGATSLVVARWNGTAATVVVSHKWTIAPASMRGTIYYWANNQGRVMRIKPGASAPDDFSAGTFGGLPASGCTMTCHTVSADGSTLVSGGDTLGGSYDLLGNKPIYDTGGAAGSAQKRLWSNAALSPNGKYLVQNGTTSVPGPPGAMDGLWDTKTGARVAASNLDGVRMGMPSFAPDGTKIAHVQTNTGSLAVWSFDMATAKAGAETVLLPKGAGAPISWPSVTPDAKWIVYHRGDLDTRNGTADLFLASANTPNQEIRLAKLDGDGYPFAAGSRDLSWNYEPTFAPVPAGGFFWVVFTSRRTYGNKLTGAKDVVKQLWVAAIDLSVTPGTDPSHPAFLLPGQDETSVNMRGFWALDPCKGDGKGCTSGTECCGGFCDGSGPEGALVCKSAGTCANDGDHCETTADCCNAATGTTCINHVCAEPGPK
ncbi:MAG: hypothetical protein JNL38_12665 [Myxococcales bacterium]|jgi:hypothetical protein|nr:hypothetical protein [Myxococcales bacterium]